MSFFTGGDGLALAAAMEDDQYPIEELVYDLANLRGGFRFHGDEDRYEGRLAWACRRSTAPIPCSAIWNAGFRRNTDLAPTKWWPTSIITPLKQRWMQEVAEEGDIDRVFTNGAACYGASPRTHLAGSLALDLTQGTGRAIWMKPKARPSLTFRRWNTARPTLRTPVEITSALKKPAICGLPSGGLRRILHFKKAVDATATLGIVG